MSWYRLKSVGLKRNEIKELMKYTDSYTDLISTDFKKMKQDLNLSDNKIELIYKSKSCEKYYEDIENLEKLNINLIDLKDEKYPELLKHIADPPIFLYYKGDLSICKEKSIAVVGTRKATSYGKEFTRKLSEELVKADVTLVSGLALGIDIVCHKTALENNGKTIGVLGTGLDKIYPWENRKEWDRISKEGLLITEFPIETEPLRHNFPFRNRIIVGLSRGVVVVESAEKGGSLITASLALDEGRDVFALPGDIISPYSKGCNNLIKLSEAKLITSTEDILNEYGWKIEILKKEKYNKISDGKLEIYNALTTTMNLDELIAITGLDKKKILGNLVELEIEGIVSSVSGGRYKRKV